MALPEQRNLDLGPITIAYREKGTGTPLVFIHGMGGNSAAWEGQYDAFADRYRVIGWDGPGYGDSGEFADDRPVVADYVDALAQLFDALGIEAAHLAGHSLGGVIVSAFNKRHGDRVLSLALIQAVTGYGREDTARRAERNRERKAELDGMSATDFARHRAERALAPGASAELIEHAATVSYAIRPRGYLQAWHALTAADIFAELDGIDKRVLFVAGEHDRVAGGGDWRAIAAAIPDVRYEIVPAVGHVPHFEAPDVLNRLLGEFLIAEM